jgi:hypothetical protein
MPYFIGALAIVYLMYTLNFAIRFNKKHQPFTSLQMVIHNILFWIIPFFWIIIIKSIAKPPAGSHQFKKTNSVGSFYESGIGIYGHHEHHHSDSDGGTGSGDD